MSKRPTGYKAQLTGDQAEIKVEDVLNDAKIWCAKMSKDNGEDFLVELGAYSNDRGERVEPQIGMLQVKGHRAETVDQIDPDCAKRVVDVDKLRRWAAHPTPVILIAVDLVDSKPTFFAGVLDKIILCYAPNGLAELSQNSITITLPRRDDLAGFVRQEVKEFYAKNAFQLDALEQSAIERNHYEVLSRKDHNYPSTAKIRSASFRILWKGPWRPAHFWASLNHLADHLQNIEAGQTKPFTANFHVYRSYRDMVDNNAVAHMKWVEERHPETDTIKEITRFPKPKNWARFKFNTASSSLDVVDHQFPQMDDSLFLEEAGRIWAALDRVFEIIRENLSDVGRLDKTTLQTCKEISEDLRFVQVEKLGFPSPQYALLDNLLQSYASRLDAVMKWIADMDDISESTRQRWLWQDIDIAIGLYKAFAPVEAQLSGRTT